MVASAIVLAIARDRFFCTTSPWPDSSPLKISAVPSPAAAFRAYDIAPPRDNRVDWCVSDDSAGFTSKFCECLAKGVMIVRGDLQAMAIRIGKVERICLLVVNK